MINEPKKISYTSKISRNSKLGYKEKKKKKIVECACYISNASISIPPFLISSLCLHLTTLLRPRIEKKKEQIMMKKSILVPCAMIMILLLPDAVFADPRTHTVKFICGNQLEHNATLFVPNFIAAMEIVSTQIRTSGYGIAQAGTGPDTNYGLAQCYGDLSLVDCVLCYAEARTILPQCYPVNGARLFLDGCFMRSENYSFYGEYTGPEDQAVCGNITRQDSGFQASTRQAMSQAVSDALNNNGYARAKVAVAGTRNESAYVLADCWRTVNASACRACFDKASAFLEGCLPSSEGRALNTGCFMRYSDTDFLNPIPGNGNSRGKKCVLN